MDLDVVILGTGLSESIAAAALSKAGYKIAHIDSNPYYGGDDASLTLDELVAWADERSGSSSESSTYLVKQRKRFSGVTYSGSIPAQSRQYTISLQPTIIPSIGPLIDSLIASGVSRYGGFKLLERVAIFERPGVVKPVPSSKEDVFKNKQLSLLHKRRLMRFLMFAGGDFEGKSELQENEQTPFAAFLRDKFSLDEEAIQVIVYALAFCISDTDPTLPALHRVRRYLRSTGRYGPSSFLVGHYGGLGEISQGFCRSAAVGGATYILGRNVVSFGQNPSPELSARKYAVQLQDLPEELYCDVLIISKDYARHDSTSAQLIAPNEGNNYSIARCVAIIDQSVSFSATDIDSEPAPNPVFTDAVEPGPQDETPVPSSEVDTALLVFPPSSVPDGSPTTAVNVLISGEASMATPRGKRLLQIYMPIPDEHAISQTSEGLLRPYLEATLSLLSRPAPETNAISQPLFSLFYIQHPDRDITEMQSATEPPSNIITTGPYSPFMPEIADSATIQAEATFWYVVTALKAAGRSPQKSTEEAEAEGGGSIPREVESFWPPLEYVEDADDW